jgi:hypothetical protein
MSRFSASDAALSGFRFIRREPRTVLVWAGVLFLYELIYGLLVLGLARDKFAAVQAFRETNNTDPEAALAMLPAASPVLLLTFVALLAMAALMFSAAYRAQLTPETHRWGHLRLGWDELRFGGLIFIWIALWVGASFIVTFFTALLYALGSALPPMIGLPYMLLLIVAAVGALVYPIVRLSLSMPMTYADAHVRLLESWKPTRGRFWPLLGAYLLTAVFIAMLWLFVWFVISALAVIVALLARLPLTTFSHDLLNTDRSSLATYLRPLSLIAAMINSLLGAASLAIFCSPVAEAYRALADDEGASEAAAA